MAMQILLFLVNILLTPCLPPLLCAAHPVDSKISSVNIFFFPFASVMCGVPLAYYEVTSTSSTKS